MTFKGSKMNSIHPSIFYTRPIRWSGRGGGWSPSQRTSGERQGTPWTGRQSITGPHRDKQPHTLTLTSKDNLELSINLTCMFFGRWEEARVPGENPRIHGAEHANSTQKGPSWELNLEPSCCEATVLTTTPPCSPSLMWNTFFYQCVTNWSRSLGREAYSFINI